MIRIVVVAGRIGCGKSTLLECLEREGYSVLPEPVEQWREKGWLEKFYENPKAKAFSFQLGVYNTAITNVQQKLATCKNPKGGILFVERYIYDQLLFWQTQIESGRVDEMDNEVYMGIWQRFRDYIPEPSGYILLLDNPIQRGGGGRASSPHDHLPKPCMGNDSSDDSSEISVKECNLIKDYFSEDSGGVVDGILARGRPEELKASKDGGLDEYQKVLGRKHLEFFASGRAHPPHAPPNGFPCIHLETRLYPYHKEQTQIVEIIEEWIEKING